MQALTVQAWPFFGWLLKATLQGSVLVCLILLIRLLLRNRLPVRWHYCLWLILLVRLSLPWSPQSRLSIYGLYQPSRWARPVRSVSNDAIRSGSDRPQAEGSGQMQAEAIVGTDANAKPAEHPTLDSRRPDSRPSPAGGRMVDGFRANAPTALPVLWLIGAVALAGCILWRNLSLWRAVKGERSVTDQQLLDLLEDCKMQMHVQTIVGVVVTDRVGSPALFGVVRPRILLPQGLLEALSLEDLHYVFLHELAHLKRRDIYLAWLVCLLQVLHWFNPVIWLAFRRMRADQEMAADALALATAGTDESRRYGQTILSLIERFSRPQYLPSLAGILESPSHIERRMTMIARFTKCSCRWSPLGIATVVVLGIVSVIDPTRGAVSASPASQAKPAMTMRMVQKEIEDHVSISPDGRYLCGCGTWAEVGGITIRELATGEQHTINPIKRIAEETGPQDPVMSPDNRMIAYRVSYRERADVCLIEADGSGQRILYPGIISSIKETGGSPQSRPYPGMVRPIRWFPDGSRILCLRWRDPMRAFKEIEIVSVSITDGSAQVIKTLAGEFFGTTVRLSPDAKYVAFETPSKDNPAKRDIFAIEIDSQRETPLVGHAADDRLLDWTPDGRHILFISDRIGPWSVWFLPVVKGEAQGTPEVVAHSTGDIKPVGFAGNGSYYYRMRYSAGDIYTAAINVSTGQLLSALTPLEGAGSKNTPDWSPDGKYLAYCSKPITAAAGEPDVIRIRSLATGEERELIPKLPQLFRCLRWAPDGRSLLASWWRAYKPEELPFTTRVYRIDAATGDTTILLEMKDSATQMAELSPDGKTLYYTAEGERIIRREIDTGQENKIFTYPPKGPWTCWALSPSGEFIATGSNEGTRKKAEGGVKKVLLIPTQGGSATELLRWDEPAGILVDFAWSRDSKTVLFTLYREPVTGKNEKQITELWQVSKDGGQPSKIMETELGISAGSLRVLPDGQRLAFRAGVVHGELWVMENFLPPEAGTAAGRNTLPPAEQRWTNSLGMVFVPVKGTKLQFSIWETRVKDFEAFVKATSRDMGNKMTCFNSELKHDVCEGYSWRNPGYAQGPDHPVVGVNWEDAVAFCKWLTEKERDEGILKAGQAYRLPSDLEWSAAVGLETEGRDTGEEPRQKARDTYPWGTQWPPPKGAGNYADVTAKAKYRPDWPTIEGYDDGYAEAAPVGSHDPSPCGLFDVGGNVAEWCGYWWSTDADEYRSLRGASWLQGDPDSLRSWHHIGVTRSRASSPEGRASYIGFRVVLEH